MTSNINPEKNLVKKKIILSLVISLFIIVVAWGLKVVYAYYHDSVTSGILANKVGDFDTGDGDINMLIFKENDEGEFVRVYAIPAAYYTFNDSLTSCTIPCNDGNGNCEYTYDSTNNNITLTSNQKITCKFYFEKEASSDINVYILVEDEAGTYTYNSKTYELRDNIPAYGYEYTENYVCDSTATVTYNSETKKFNVATQTQNNCYVYFDSVGSSDITVNVYVQSSYGSEVYNIVNSIPANKIYTLNETRSICTPVNSGGVAGTITYTDGYINIAASEKQVCDVYLDLESN